MESPTPEMIDPRQSRPARRKLGSCLAILVPLAFWGGGSLVSAAEGVNEPRNTASLKGVDLDGQARQFGQRGETNGVVAVFLSTQCPISNGYLPLLNSLASTYRRRGVEFCGIISDPTVSRTEAVEHRKVYHISFPVLFDASGELRQILSPTHTPQAFVLDRDGELAYSGAIDDLYVKLGRKKERATRSYLEEAVKAVIAGEGAQVRQTTPVGCLLEELPDKSRSSSVTYARDIAPIIQANCASCHRPGQSGPFSLLTYDEVSKHARQVATVTRARFMPPWKPAPGFGRFLDERRLSEYELSLLESWVRTGKAKGDDADLPASLAEDGGWRLGEPDQILRMRQVFTVPASGPDVRQYFVIPTRLGDNRLLTAIDFRPGAPQSVHHASFFLDTKGAARRLDDADPQPGYAAFGGPGFRSQGTLRSWFPGMSPRHLPDGMGRLVPRGSDIVAEVHYVCSGKTEHDRSSIGLYYGSRSSRQLVEEIQIANKQILIPAGAARHHERATYTLPVDTILLDVAPHMHELGREMKVAATLPDGRVEPLVWVPDWDFNWQSQYSYAEPIRLPKGSRIDVDAWYDNSAENPLNPNSPPKNVIWGEDSTDEMLICHFQCTCESMDELTILMADYQRYFDDAQRPRSDPVEDRQDDAPKPRKPRPFR